MKRNLLLALVVVIVAVVILAVVLVVTSPSATSGSPKTVTETVKSDGRLTKLSAGIFDSAINNTLNGSSHWTLFAPTDEAFDDADPALVNTSTMWNTLTYHYAAGWLNTSDMYSNLSLPTASARPVVLTVNETGHFVNDAKILQSIQCSNGVIHIIDMVLPPVQSIFLTTGQDGNFTKLNGALSSAGKALPLITPGSFTLFAPSDPAVASMGAAEWNSLLSDQASLRKVLDYHLLPYRLMSSNMTDGSVYTTSEGSTLTITVNGTGTYVNGARVVTTDIVCTNGVVHVIDKVMIPPDVTL